MSTPTEYHIVHIESVKKVAERKKPAELEQVRKAAAILNKLNSTMLGQKIVQVENPARLDHPPLNGVRVILGGAFDGQCLAEYEKTLTKNGIPFERDENLILK